MENKGIWEWLNIAPTCDQTKIKQAYAEQAKKYHPEEHPEEFKALQHAYKMAVAMAKNSNVSGDFRMDDESVDDTAYNYSDVYEKMNREVKDKFLLDFRLIAYNYFLIRRANCFKILLDQEEYKDLLKDEAFVYEWISDIISIRGWKKEEIQFFEDKIKEALGYPVAIKLKWYRRLFCFNMAHKGIKDMHNKFLSQLSSDGLVNDLNLSEGIMNYLDRYLPFARKNEEAIKKYYDESGITIAFFYEAIIIFIIMFILPALLNLSGCRDNIGADADTIMNENTEENAVADIVPDYSYDEIMNEILEDAISRYENWR